MAVGLRDQEAGEVLQNWVADFTVPIGKRGQFLRVDCQQLYFPQGARALLPWVIDTGESCRIEDDPEASQFQHVLEVVSNLRQRHFPV